MAGVKGRSGGPRPNSGGARPGAGRPPAESVFLDAPELSDAKSPREFLMALMNNAEADAKLRLDAAKALLSAEIRATEAKGKKEQKQEAAEAVAAGRFGLRAVK